MPPFEIVLNPANWSWLLDVAASVPGLSNLVSSGDWGYRGSNSPEALRAIEAGSTALQPYIVASNHLYGTPTNIGIMTATALDTIDTLTKERDALKTKNDSIEKVNKDLNTELGKATKERDDLKLREDERNKTPQNAIFNKRNLKRIIPGQRNPVDNSYGTWEGVRDIGLIPGGGLAAYLYMRNKDKEEKEETNQEKTRKKTLRELLDEQ